MNEYEERVQRTWTQLLLDLGKKQAAAIAVDSEVAIQDWNWVNVIDDFGEENRIKVLEVDANVPTTAWGIVTSDDNLRNALIHALQELLSNRRVVLDLNEVYVNRVDVTLGIRIMDIELGWEQVIRSLIVQTGINNQGLISEKASARRKEAPLLYNELKFGSQSEIRIAQELERRKVLFFPLAVAVKYDTGNFYNDHREVDFLVCQEGVWGVLEVAYHPDRYEKDAEKTQWFKDAGILCVEHHSAERCYNHTSDVIDKFLSTLSKHKR